MDSEDVMKVEVYKERRKHWKGDRKRRERKETKEKALEEESEQNQFYTIPISLGAPV